MGGGGGARSAIKEKVEHNPIYSTDIHFSVHATPFLSTYNMFSDLSISNWFNIEKLVLGHNATGLSVTIK